MKKPLFKCRVWHPSDAESLAKHANNIKIWKNVRDFFPHPYTLEDALFYINIVKDEKKPLNFAIAVDDQAVGGIGLVPGQDVERLNAEIGYWLGEEFWGQGIMTAAVKEMVGYTFENLDFVRLHTHVFEYNIPSMHVLEKVGFTK